MPILKCVDYIRHSVEKTRGLWTGAPAGSAVIAGGPLLAAIIISFVVGNRDADTGEHVYADIVIEDCGTIAFALEAEAQPVMTSIAIRM